MQSRFGFAGRSVLRLILFAASLWGVLGLSAISAAAASEGFFHRNLQIAGSTNLDVSTGSGNIQIRTGSSNEVQITGRIKVMDWFGGISEQKLKLIEDNPPIQQTGNMIRIGHIEDPELRRHVSISYELIVPAETQVRAQTGSGNENIEGIQGSLDVSSGSGELKISTIGNTVRADTGSGGIQIDHVKGNVHAKTGSGSIRATGIAGGFEGTTGSGDLRLEQTSPGSVRVRTGSGTMDLNGLRGSLEASSGSGSIRADGDPTGAWKIHTGSGGVELRFPSNAAFDLDAHTSSGSVSSDVPVLAQTSTGKKELRGKVRGGGVSVEIATGSGDIELH